MRRGVPNRGEEEGAAICAMGVKGGAGVGVGEEGAGEARVGIGAEDTCASGYGFEGGGGWALEVSIAEGIGGGASQQCGHIHNHALQAHISIGRNERHRPFGSILRQRKWPRALPGTLCCGITHPSIHNFSAGRSAQLQMLMKTARASTHTFYSDIGCSEYKVNSLIIKGELALL